jgi:hypothetical protein
MKRLLPVMLFVACSHTEAEPYAFEWVDPAHGNGAASEVYDDRAARARKEVFWAGGEEQTPLSDYLFVIDPSVSMDVVLDRFQRGFAQLAADNPFPDKARIAVMWAVPAHPERPNSHHPAVRWTPGLDRSPGFQRLVSKQTIETYRSKTRPDLAAFFADDGCDAWFEPTATNEKGTPCIVAHTQIPLLGLGPEAGLTAVGQLLDRPQPLFRPGAAANIIFVSDTHDPGFGPLKNPEGFDELVAMRPTFEDLHTKVASEELVSSLRVHAIAPRTECVEPWKQDIGPTYFTATTAAGGVSRDICTSGDFSGFIREMAETGSVVRQAVFPLSTKAIGIESVQIDGKDVPYTLSRDRVVVLDRPVGDTPEAIEVTYRYPSRTRTQPVHDRQVQQPPKAPSSAAIPGAKPGDKSGAESNLGK